MTKKQIVRLDGPQLRQLLEGLASRGSLNETTRSDALRVARERGSFARNYEPGVTQIDTPEFDRQMDGGIPLDVDEESEDMQLSLPGFDDEDAEFSVPQIKKEGRRLRESPMPRNPDQNYAGDMADMASTSEAEMREYWALEKERLCSESGGTPEDIADLMSAELGVSPSEALNFVTTQLRAEGSPC